MTEPTPATSASHQDIPFGGRLTVFRLSLLTFLLAFALRLGIVVLLPNFGALPPTEMERVAASWATAGELANPYATPTGPTGHLAPGYPIIIGTIYRLFGTGAEGRFAQNVFGCFLSALRCALMVPLAVVLRLGYRTALIAGFLSVFYISAFGTEVRGTWEAPLTALLLVCLSFIAARFAERPHYSPRTAVAFGAFAGIATLIAPNMLPTMTAMLVAAVLLRRDTLARNAAWGAAIALIGGLIVSPWLIRNQRVLGVATLRTNFGLELALAYNAAERTNSLDPDMTKMHPTVNPTVSREVARVGEVRFNRERRAEALNWISSHPLRALRLVAVHGFYFWFPPAESRVFRLAMAATTLLAAVGFVQLKNRSRLALWIIGLIWLTYPVIYYITFWSSRYRYPMDWTLVLCAAVTIATLWDRVSPLRTIERRGLAASRPTRDGS